MEYSCQTNTSILPITDIYNLATVLQKENQEEVHH